MTASMLSTKLMITSIVSRFSSNSLTISHRILDQRLITLTEGSLESGTGFSAMHNEVYTDTMEYDDGLQKNASPEESDWDSDASNDERDDPQSEDCPEPNVSQSVDLGQNNNPNTTPTKDYKNVQVVVYLRGVQRGCAEEGERGSTPTG